MIRNFINIAFKSVNKTENDGVSIGREIFDRNMNDFKTALHICILKIYA